MIGESIGRYRIVEQIGKGGMGVVYRAEDTELNRSVALKFLSEKAIKSDQEMARFVREAQAAASLDHANICPVYEIGQYGDMPYIAMPFIEGQSLKEQIQNDFMSIQEVVDLALQIATGLAEAHSCGVIHRDIKSENIMINMAGQAKIMDFGLAKLTDQTGHTPSGYTLGTIAYLSPEQARGEPVDQKTDIWSLGVVLYEMITGQLPFNKDTEAGMVYSILSDSPLAPTELRSDLPRELERITYRALRKRQSDRYQSVGELITDLQALKRSFEEAAWTKQVTTTGKVEPRKETEHRFATIMYADIVGYSVLLEEQDPEEVTRIMNRCFESFDLIARKYGGRVDTILENNITALFGVPQAVENSPRAAINTAIEWLTATHQLNADENLGHFLDLKIGINSGPVIAGMMGPDRRVEYSAVGTTTILASELKGLAEESQILAGAATYQQAKDIFNFRQLKPVTRKGWKEPIRAFEMMTRVPVLQTAELRMGSGIYSDLVGRGEELEQLEFHVHKVVHGEGSIVNLIGEAGVGKSRLIDELAEAKIVERVTFLEGRALSIGQYLSYHPIIDILKSWAGIKEEDSEAVSLAKLERVVQEVDPDEAPEIFPFIATLMGMRLSGRYAERISGIEGEALENLIMKSLTDLLIKGSDQGPIVFVVHDVHWADQTSIEVLESLFRLSDRHPILFINVLRPDYPETSDRLVESIKDRYGTQYFNIDLHRLTEEDSQVLIRNLFKSTELPEVIQKAITNRTEGNPYFIEEVVRSLLDQGVVKVEGGILRLREDIDSLHIPETIQDLLMTRIDRLDESTRNLLKEASVIGRYFFFKILEEMNQVLDQEAISEHLSTLLQIQLIRKSARQEELEYLFKHALAHDVTYDSIPPNKRKELHLKVAGAIESVFLERLHEFYGMLALHYSNAEEPDKAEEYLERAGEVALKAAASIEALTYFQKALNIYQREHGESADPAKIAALEENIGIALYNKGKMQECVPYFDRVLEHLGEAKTRARTGAPEGKKSPWSNLVEIGRLLINFLRILKNVSLSPRRSRPLTPYEDRLVGITGRKIEALVSTDARRFFLDSLRMLNLLLKRDLRGNDFSLSYSLESSSIFSVAGVSFWIAKRILEISRPCLEDAGPKPLISYEFSDTIYQHFSGHWQAHDRYDEPLVDENIKNGEGFVTGAFLANHGYIGMEQGHFAHVKRVVDRLDEIGASFDNEYFKVRKYALNSQLLYKRRRLHEAKAECEEGLNSTILSKQNFYPLKIMGTQASALLLLGKEEAAWEVLVWTEEIIRRNRKVLPFYLSNYLIARFQFELHRLKRSPRSGDGTAFRNQKSATWRIGQLALKNVANCAAFRTEAENLMGTCCWLLGKNRRARRWWGRSIRSGKELGALPELARTYAEIGKLCAREKGRKSRVHGLTPDQCREKARVIFTDLHLDWDLAQLGQVPGQD